MDVNLALATAKPLNMLALTVKIKAGDCVVFIDPKTLITYYVSHYDEYASSHTYKKYSLLIYHCDWVLASVPEYKTNGYELFSSTELQEVLDSISNRGLLYLMTL